jgi:hypothetical protein
MKSKTRLISGIAVLSISLMAAPAMADKSLRCDSKNHHYRMCKVDTHGYVRLTREHSHNKCKQGRTWDYDRRGVWVDDGCSADFVVESRHHTNDHKDHKGDAAVAAVAGIALIAAAIASSKSNDHDDRYHDDDYHHSGHSSYLPGWMVGKFKGYNMRYGSDVKLVIEGDGRVKAVVQGTKLSGYVNDGRLYVGDAEFYIERAGEGFNTVQTGDRSNKVHYTRK